MRVFRYGQPSAGSKKRIKTAAYTIMALAAAIGLSIGISGCSQGETEEEPEAAAPSSQNSSALSAHDKGEEYGLPDASFGVESMKRQGLGIANLQGGEADISVSDARLLTAFSEGYSLGSWEDAEGTRYALFDAAGNAAIDLTSDIEAAGVSGKSTLEGAVNAFSDERLVMPIRMQNSPADIVVVFDENGKAVYVTKCQEGYFVGNAYDRPAYHDGVLMLSEDGVAKLLDTEGNVLVSSNAVSDPIRSLGFGLYEKRGDSSGLVYGYDGKAVFDVSSLADGDITSASLYKDQPGANGIICVKAEFPNPEGFGNVWRYGLYGISDEAWVVPLDGGMTSFSQANDGIIWAKTEMPSSSNESAGSNAALSRGSEKSAFYDGRGNVVFDASMVEDGSIPDDFQGVYLHDGWWQIQDGNGTCLALAYFENGRYVGMSDPIPYLAMYPNSEYYFGLF